MSLRFRPHRLLLGGPPLGLYLPLPLDPHHFPPGLPFDANPNISNSCINTYRIIIINLYPLLLATPTTLLVEVGALANVDAAVDAEVAVDEVLAEETESAALAAGFDVGFFGGLLHSALGDFGRLSCSLHPYL